ncbi:MAG: ScyD/ScyE family protein [Vicinamibacterales bacterium]
MVRQIWRPAVIAGAAALAVALVQPLALRLDGQSTLQVIASGLFNPRGLNFSPDGGLYVAEAGRGRGPNDANSPCIVNSNNEDVCYGATGAIVRITLGTPGYTRVVTGLPSLAGEDGSGATGPHDVDFQGKGNGYVTIGAGLAPGRRLPGGDGDNTAFASVGLKFSRLVRFQPNGKWSFEEDLGLFEALANPDGNAQDSNPYGVLALPSRQVFTDAGGNSLNAVAANGSIANLGVFPNRLVQNPFAPPGVMMPMQAVPTTVVAGPGNTFYVGQLTGFPFPPGGANVYKVSPGGVVEVFASGFTNIIDIALAKDGSLYVLEIAANGLRSGNPVGALIRVLPDGTKQTVVAPGGGLFMPGGVAIGPDGALYVTNWSVLPGGGTVVKIVP